MANKRDYYEVLGVSKTATQDELKKAYRKLSMQYHPDRQAGKSDTEKKDAEEKFKEVSEAYSILSDKDKRAQYDQFGFEGPNMGGSGGFGGFDPFEMFRRHFGGNGSPFEDDDDCGFNPFSFGGFGRHSNRQEQNFDAPEDGSDLQMSMQLTFKESLFGCVKEIDVPLNTPCQECNGRGIEKGSMPSKCTHCNGTGHIVNTVRNGFMMSQTITSCPHCHGQGMSMKVCPKCHGSKRIDTKKHLSVKVPMGIGNGQRLRVRGKGECGVKGGKDGDMYINVLVEPNSLFERRGQDLKTIMPIDAATATLGGKVDVQTPWGKATVNVSPKTTSGTSTRIVGHGIKSSTQTGDLIVEFNVKPFDNLNSNQKKLLEELKKSLSSSNIYGKQKYQAAIDEFLKK